MVVGDPGQAFFESLTEKKDGTGTECHLHARHGATGFPLTSALCSLQLMQRGLCPFSEEETEAPRLWAVSAGTSHSAPGLVVGHRRKAAPACRENGPPAHASG